MSSADASRDLREATPASAMTRCGRARHAFLSIMRDSASFLGLLARTLWSLPVDVLAASVVINLLGLALPLGILQVYDRIVPHSSKGTLTFLVIGICCAL